MLSVAVLLLLAGCGARTQAAAPRQDPDPLRGHAFTATQVPGRTLAAGTTVTVRFTEDGRIVAGAGCNSMSGQYTTDGGRLHVADLATTDMGCDADRNAQDTWLAGVLGAEPAFRLDDTSLTLTTASGPLALQVVRNLPLEGRAWHVDTVIDGQVAGSAPSQDATVSFSGGTLTVQTGCNGGAGSYTLSGSTITLGQVVSTDRACVRPEGRQLEAAVVQVLSGTLTYRVDGDRLTLTNAAGKGLGLHA